MKNLLLPEFNEYRRLEAEITCMGQAGGAGEGIFLIPWKKFRSAWEPWMTPDYGLAVIVSRGGGWDHISVSLPNRCPTWEEMELVRHLFAESYETWVQFGVPPKQHINYHPYVLHWWRDQHRGHRLPPPEMVGPPTRRNINASAS